MDISSIMSKEDSKLYTELDNTIDMCNERLNMFKTLDIDKTYIDIIIKYYSIIQSCIKIKLNILKRY